MCAGVLHMEVCVCAPACLLHSLSLISPAGLVRLFLGALSSQLGGCCYHLLSYRRSTDARSDLSLLSVLIYILIVIISRDAAHLSV